MKKHDFLQSMKDEAQDINIPELNDELKSHPITIVPVEIRPTKKRRAKPLQAFLLTLVLVMGLGVCYSLYIKEETLITIDINPSIEIRLNKFDRVIGVSAYNDEGEEFLRTLSLNNCTLEEAIHKTFLHAHSFGYFKSDTPQNVLFSVKSIYNCNEWTYSNLLCETLSKKYDYISPLLIEPEDIDEVFSRKIRVSPAKFAFFRKLYKGKYGKAIDASAVTGDMLDYSVSELVSNYA